MRRLKRMQVSPELLMSLLRHEYGFIQKGIPKDAKIINIYFDNMFERNIYWILIESKAFEEIPEGGLIPELFALMERI